MIPSSVTPGLSRSAFVGGLFAAAFILASCGQPATPAAVADAATVKAGLSGDDASRDALYALYAAARAANEPGATIYVASVPEELKPLSDAFAASFPGLRADFQRFIGDKLAARLDGEYGSGKHTGDVVLASVIEERNLGRAGRLTAWTPPTLAGLAAADRDAKGFWHVPYRKVFTIAYNPGLVPVGEVPATLSDVLDPKWRGRYAFPSAGISGPSITALSLLAGKGQVSDAQIVAFDRYGTGGPASSELIPSVAQGRYAFALWVNAAAVIAQRDEGAPMQVGFSPQLSVTTNVAAGVLERAPHAESAKLFVAWLFTPAAQKIITDLYFYGAQPDAPLPQGFPAPGTLLNSGVVEDEAFAARMTAFYQHRAALVAAAR